MKLLFIHNTIPDYRIPFFKRLSSKIDVKYLFTNIELNKKVYNNDVDYSNLRGMEISTLPKGIKHYTKLIEILLKYDYEYVIIPPMDSLKEYIDSLISFIVAKLKKKKILYFWEKWEAPSNKMPLKKKIKNNIQKMICKPIIKFVDVCIASGTKSKEYFEMYNIDKRKIHVAYDACEVEVLDDVEDIRLKYNINEDEKVILYYGRIIERKGLDILIKAFKNVQDNSNSKVHLMVCGDGEFRETCEKLAKDMDVKYIYFEGHISPSNRYKYFSKCDIFVLPSYFYEGTTEAWGLTVNEAIQLEKVVIATNAVGAAYDLISKDNGIMIEENNQKELENALLHFINDYDIDKISSSNKEVFSRVNYNNMSDSFIEALKLSDEI